MKKWEEIILKTWPYLESESPSLEIFQPDGYGPGQPALGGLAWARVGLDGPRGVSAESLMSYRFCITSATTFQFLNFALSMEQH